MTDETTPPAHGSGGPGAPVHPAAPSDPLTLDARGERCPLPIIRLAALLKDRASGRLVTLLATDPAARSDVPAFCRMRGHTLVRVTEVSGATGLGDHTAYLVRRG